MSKLEPAPPRAAVDAAAHWFLLLQDPGASSQNFIEWQQWLNAAPEHRAAYEDIENTVLRIERIGAKPSLPTADELAADTYDGSLSVAEWQQRTAAAVVPAPGRYWYRYALAASFVIAMIAASWLWLRPSGTSQVGAYAYSTASGQKRVIHLPDGSRVTLDADSALSVDLTRARRNLNLERGEAYFQVAKDARRPFVVRVGSAQVTAVGTAFNVRLSDNRTVVAVTEGKVEFVATPRASTSIAKTSSGNLSHANITTPRLAAQVAAGEAVSYLDEGNLQALPPPEAPLATAWLEGRRQYRNEPLRYVLADVDRYTGQRIELANEAVGELRFTGTLNLENSHAWLRGLAVALPVTVEEKQDGVLSIALRGAVTGTSGAHGSNR